MRDIRLPQGVQTPVYYYDMDLLATTAAKVRSLSEQYGIHIHYATKANEDARIVSALAAEGFGADCVSAGELELAAACGVKPSAVVLSGVGKSDEDILCALRMGIGAINVESVQELYVVNALAAREGVTAKVCIRVNPNIDAHTFKYVTSGLNVNKFGVSPEEFDEFEHMLSKCSNVKFIGVQMHLGSQIRDIRPVFEAACRKAVEAADWFAAKGYAICMINLGGGLGVCYEDPDSELIPDFEQWMLTISRNIPRREGMTIHIEPGRALVAQCGTLLSRVLFVKDTPAKTFLVLDAGMNNLARPAFYGAFHKIENLSAMQRPMLENDRYYDVVGPSRQSADTWGKGRRMPLSVRGDLIAIRSAGAYGQAMATRYNLRPDAQTIYSDNIK
ncbi:MAG: diaminopimelate decarboxylase [Bacteroidales bacterium]|nr:diaminopimelate decarboxylase [Bacteroidales bacterium]